MKPTQRRIHQAVLIGFLVSVKSSTAALRAEDTNAAGLPAPVIGAADTNTVELVRQLLRRIEELEQKVPALEREQAAGAAVGNVNAQQHIEELDQKIKVLERERELDREANEAAAREAPKISIGGVMK